MGKKFIQNRKGQKVVVLVEENKESKGLVFVMHGLGGNKEQAHIGVIAEVFKNNGYTVVRFDTTNTYGESYGKFEDATTTNYYADLEDVINWAKSQKWYKEPFILAGHSLGGICIALYAEKYPNKVKALAPLGTVISGKLSLEIKSKEEIEKWKHGGIMEWEGFDGRIKRLKWSEPEDRLKYDLMSNVKNLEMPVLMIVGENDNSCPYNHQKILFDALPTKKKELHLIKGAPHTFRDKVHLEQMKSIFYKWIKSIQ